MSGEDEVGSAWTASLQGRELDALVAEKVMGWRHEATAEQEAMNGVNGIGVLGCVHFRDVIGLVMNHNVPYYSRDIAAAWSVVERMLVLGWYFDLRNYGTWTAIFDRDGGAFDNHATEDAETAPLAICVTALAALRLT